MFGSSRLTRKGEFEDVSFQVKKGEIFGVAGLVGAGRTELFSCIYGLTKSHSGSLYLNGKEVVMKSPVDVIANGIGLVPEERKTGNVCFTVHLRKRNDAVLSYDQFKRCHQF